MSERVSEWPGEKEREREMYVHAVERERIGRRRRKESARFCHRRSGSSSRVVVVAQQ